MTLLNWLVKTDWSYLWLMIDWLIFPINWMMWFIIWSIDWLMTWLISWLMIWFDDLVDELSVIKRTYLMNWDFHWDADDWMMTLTCLSWWLRWWLRPFLLKKKLWAQACALGCCFYESCWRIVTSAKVPRDWGPNSHGLIHQPRPAWKIYDRNRWLTYKK